MLTPPSIKRLCKLTVFNDLVSFFETITISINIDSHIDKFAINIFDDNIKKKEILVDIKDPFQRQKNRKSIHLDRRVEAIRDYLIGKDNSIQNLIFNKKVVKLWSEIETD